ncbi:hypothetical protein EIN_112850 [Entamoeba invadens IP1]|uniref:Uncharacterized protein n=1 Tax=Entamoeba invadens IP1 TaxID=370355 RepID=A0A0A1U171_ENTIV|nr:hypothetical protein EIN_112850 [Entamoeba invadens IP1]ELP86251.1 hypothetical protein EIN_112850 [Entamoeba invadens IP1]|eukprot:XP_004185597.1 hypothetical protein EIN_112850 [Entamoeba invadens IP1]
MSKSTPQYYEWTDVEPMFLQNFQNSVLHFIDFEFANQYSAIPETDEIGVSTVSLANPAEHDSFHVIIRCKKSDKYAFKIHGINSNSPSYPTQRVGFDQFVKYLSKYSGLKIFVVKDETINGGDVKVMNSIFKTSDIQYTILTHHMLISCILRHFGKEFDEKIIKKDVNMYYKHLHISEKCEYHTKLDKKFHCALSDARNTSLSVFAPLKALCNELVFQNTELIPVYEVPKFELSDGSSFIICLCNTFGMRDSVYEILMEEVTYQNGTFIECDKEEMCFEHFVPPQVKGRAFPEIYKKLTSAYPDVENHNKKAHKNVLQYVQDHNGMYLVRFGFSERETNFDFSEMYLMGKYDLCDKFYRQCGGKEQFCPSVFYNKVEELGSAVLVLRGETDETKEFVCNIHKKTGFENKCVCEVKKRYLRGLEELARNRALFDKLEIDMKTQFEEIQKEKEKEKPTKPKSELKTKKESQTIKPKTERRQPRIPKREKTGLQLPEDQQKVHAIDDTYITQEQASKDKESTNGKIKGPKKPVIPRRKVN